MEVRILRELPVFAIDVIVGFLGVTTPVCMRRRPRLTA